METIKKQWLLIGVDLILAVWIIINPGADQARLSLLLFISLFADDERKVFFNIDKEKKMYFYLQFIVLCATTGIYGLIFYIDHGSMSLDHTKMLLSTLQIVNMILRFIMTYALIEEEEYRKKLHWSSFLMLGCFILFSHALY